MIMELLAYFLAGVVTGLAIWWLRRRLSAFSAQSPEHYASARVPFDARVHLNGPMICEGVIFGPAGRVSSRFVATFEGRWNGDSGVITEHFRYDDGETQDREWQIELGDKGKVIATADDVVGDGTGRQSGATLGMTYRIRLPQSSGGYVLDAVDWMYLLDNGTIMNRSQFRKYGIKVAELVATIRPAEAADKLENAA